MENKTILIVEDDGILAVQLQSMLIELSYTEALKAAHKAAEVSGLMLTLSGANASQT